MSSPTSLPPGFAQCGNLIRTQTLNHQIDLGLYTIGFKFADATEEPWTTRFSAFKNRDPRSVRAGAATLARAIRTLDFGSSKRIVILGAISSGETALNPQCPVYSLCEAIRSASGWEWVQSTLSKMPHRKLHGLKGGFTERDAEVKNKYQAQKIGGAPGIVMIIDDFVTRGATAAEIRRAVLSSNPGWQFGCISLGKNENVNFWRDRHSFDITNSHIHPILTRLWDSAT